LQQVADIKKNYHPHKIRTNRALITKFDINSNCEVINESDPENNAIYIVLDAPVEICRGRLFKRYSKNKFEPDAWESESSLKYFENKYKYLAYKYNIPIIDVTDKTPNQVFDTAVYLINNHTETDQPFRYEVSQYLKPDEKINLDLIELEWLHFGYSEIIYADCFGIVTQYDFPITNIESYEKSIINKLSTVNLNNFFNQLLKEFD
jgi:hypothetical protein